MRSDPTFPAFAPAPRAPIETARETRDPGAAQTHGNEQASAAGRRRSEAQGSQRSAARFDESMSRALRRSDPNADADRACAANPDAPASTQEPSADEERAGAIDTLATDGDPARSGLERFASLAAFAPVIAAAPVAVAPAVAVVAPPALAPAGPAESAPEIDSPASPGAPGAADAGLSKAVRSRPSAGAPDPVASSLGDAQANANEEATLATDAVAAQEPASRGEAFVARATADFAAQPAHTRGAFAPHSLQAVDAPRALAPGAAAPSWHSANVPTPVGDAAFPGRFAAEVALLGAAGIERAEIHLQPRELGPVRIELTMSGESARIAFSAAQPDTRQAIEQSLPILEDLLAERGLVLGDASVSDGRAGHDPDDSPAARADSPASRTTNPDSVVGRPRTADARRVSVRRAILDVYA